MVLRFVVEVEVTQVVVLCMLLRRVLYPVRARYLARARGRKGKAENWLRVTYLKMLRKIKLCTDLIL